MVGLSSLDGKGHAPKLFSLGCLCFSGSIYGLVLLPKGHSLRKLLGPVTPLGGLLFIAGWLSMAWNAKSSPATVEGRTTPKHLRKKKMRIKSGWIGKMDSSTMCNWYFCFMFCMSSTTSLMLPKTFCCTSGRYWCNQQKTRAIWGYPWEAGSSSIKLGQAGANLAAPR